MRSLRAAAFLDRDGTIVEHVPDLLEPSQLRLLPGAAEAIALLRNAGLPCIVVTNQSALGRGILAEPALAELHSELDRQLSATDPGAIIDAYYCCPVVGLSSDRTLIEHPDRKPGPGLLQRAARDHGIDLAASWMVGDSIRDLLAGQHAGCRGSVLVRTGWGERFLDRRDDYAVVCDDLRQAAHWILSQDTGRGDS
jgi:D-glycero-D-manno-heptose 1,7-bisphosphate phosphatase